MKAFKVSESVESVRVVVVELVGVPSRRVPYARVDAQVYRPERAVVKFRDGVFFEADVSGPRLDPSGSLMLIRAQETLRRQRDVEWLLALVEAALHEKKSVVDARS